MGSQKIPREGEVVLVKDDNLPRSNWKLGKIIRLIQGRDGRIRSAEVLLPGRTVISRAINYLYPLELPICEEKIKDIVLDTPQQKQGIDDQRNSDGKQQRKALIKARQAISECLRDNGSTVLFCFPQECHGHD